MGLDGFVDSGDAPSPHSKLKSHGSCFSKQDRSGFVDDDWRNSKIPKTEPISGSKTMPLHQGFPLLRSNTFISSSDGRQKEHMLSFSSLKSETSLLPKHSDLIARNPQNSIFPHNQHKSSVYSRNTGNHSSASVIFIEFSVLFIDKCFNLGERLSCIFVRSWASFV